MFVARRLDDEWFADSGKRLALPFQRIMRLDLTTLHLVLAIERSRSITAGAKSEHLALAAASKRLADLELRLGVKLFERRARGVEPTEAGRRPIVVRFCTSKP